MTRDVELLPNRRWRQFYLRTVLGVWLAIGLCTAVFRSQLLELFTRPQDYDQERRPFSGRVEIYNPGAEG